MFPTGPCRLRTCRTPAGYADAGTRQRCPGHAGTAARLAGPPPWPTESLTTHHDYQPALETFTREISACALTRSLYPTRTTARRNRRITWMCSLSVPACPGSVPAATFGSAVQARRSRSWRPGGLLAARGIYFG